mmetsp:Transcript_46851/g.118064  ORF Transcript_46851/g.118064 Transcript_46851/m.118064 type:complete len:218 (+) Transcript_46851:444-1097(+)
MMTVMILVSAKADRMSRVRKVSTVEVPRISPMYVRMRMRHTARSCESQIRTTSSKLMLTSRMSSFWYNSVGPNGSMIDHTSRMTQAPPMAAPITPNRIGRGITLIANFLAPSKIRQARKSFVVNADPTSTTDSTANHLYSSHDQSVGLLIAKKAEMWAATPAMKMTEQNGTDAARMIGVSRYTRQTANIARSRTRPRLLSAAATMPAGSDQSQKSSV